MKNILVLGAGRSSTYLINYLLQNSAALNWYITIGDFDENVAKSKLNNHPNGKSWKFDIEKDVSKITGFDLVISMLPPNLHPKVAEACVANKIHMITASYNNTSITRLNNKAIENNVLILMECGLDPGIDHLSAMKMINEIKDKGGKIVSFKSYTGGLVAPESDNNPWHYKISWNPRNVVLAGQGGAVKYLKNGAVEYIEYDDLFRKTEKIFIGEYGEFEAYANRDSLMYQTLYGLENCKTLLRGTLRRPGYCKAWDALVKLDLTDDNFNVPESNQITYKELFNTFLPHGKMAEDVIEMDDLNKIKWLGLLSDEKIGLPHASPAKILQHVIEKKLKLAPNDKDMVCMKHELLYELDGKNHEITSSLIVIGEDSINTAMAKTVGIPLGIAAKLVLEGKIEARGIQIPLTYEFYDPILEELKTFGVSFEDK
jgi:saccharopine dehydrogenase-like NADP-dependent oxidoreductase